jgi:hypothetical protein
MVEGSQQIRQQLFPDFEAEYRQPDQYILVRYNGEYDRRSKSHELMLKFGKRFQILLFISKVNHSLNVLRIKLDQLI